MIKQVDINSSSIQFQHQHTLANAVLMIKPRNFEFNLQTAQDNQFMKNQFGKVSDQAIKQFDISVQLLRSQGVNVIEFDKNNYPQYSNINTPDAVFPNNWFSTTQTDVWVYRMKATSRTFQKIYLNQILPLLYKEGYNINKVNSWKDSVIQGTGVLIFDRKFKRVYINRSQRASNLLEEFCEIVGYKLIAFQTLSTKGTPFYHTNVMMSIGDNFAVVASYAIAEKDRSRVLQSLRETRPIVIQLTPEQTELHFCGNILQLQGTNSKVIVMSQTAYNAFTIDQKNVLEKQNRVVKFPLDVIQKVGGGSARCMIAEIFLNKKK